MGFCKDLLKKHERKFYQSTTHDLTSEVCTGILPNHKLFTYLVQDLKFFQLGLKVFGNALRLCGDPQATVALGKQIGVFCGSENSYFHKVLDQLKSENAKELKAEVPKMLYQQPSLDEVQKYLDFMDHLAFKSEDYAEIVTFMYVMEKVYLGWAQYNIYKGVPDDLQYKHSEWMKLHSSPDFESWVAFLEDEVDRSAQDNTCRSQIDKVFEQTLDLEIAFFDACYTYSE